MAFENRQQEFSGLLPAEAAWVQSLSSVTPTKGTVYVANGSGWVGLGVGANGTFLKADSTTASGLAWAAVSGSGTVTDVSVVSANGFAGTVATSTTTPAITLTTSITGLLKGNGTAISAATAGTDYSLGTSALATGILKSTTTTGALTIATGADLPAMTATVGGAVPTPPNNTTTFLRGDGTFATPAGTGITGSGNANEIAYFTASTAIGSLAVASYPSLTELSYVKGASSNLQTQINAKGAGTVTAISVASSNGFTGSSSGGATPALTLATSITGTLQGNGTAISASKVILTQPATGSTLTIIDGKTLTINKTISLTAADDTGVYTLPTGTKTLLATDGSAASLTSFPTLNQNTTGYASALKSATTTVDVAAATAPSTGQVLTATDSTHATWQTPSAGGSSFWTLPAGATRVSNTTFTVTGDQTAIFKKGVIIKWTESATVRNAMVSIPSTVSTDTTVTIIGDTLTSIDASSLKYAMIGAEAFVEKFAVAGTIGATGTDIANAYYAQEPMRVIGADLYTGTAGTTNATTIDINKNGTTMFTTKPTLATTVNASPTPFTVDTTTALALNDRVSIDIDAVQTTAAIDLYVRLYVFPTRYNSLT